MPKKAEKPNLINEAKNLGLRANGRMTIQQLRELLRQERRAIPRELKRDIKMGAIRVKAQPQKPNAPFTKEQKQGIKIGAIRVKAQPQKPKVPLAKELKRDIKIGGTKRILNEKFDSGSYLVSGMIKFRSKRSQDMVERAINYKVDTNGTTKYSLAEEALAQFLEEYRNANGDSEIELYVSDIEDLRIIEWNDDLKIDNIPLKKKNLIKHVLFPSDSRINTNHPDECVINGYITAKNNKRSIKSLTRDKVIDKLGTTAPTAQQFIDFVQKNDKYTSVLFCDPYGELVARTEVVEGKRVQNTICFMINNNHAYLIEDENMRSQLIKRQKIDMSTYKFQISLNEFNSILATGDPLQCDKQYVLIDTECLAELATRVIQETGFYINTIHFNRSNITMFKNPTKDQIYIAAPEYEKRRKVASTMYELSKNSIFSFSDNASWAQLSLHIFEQFNKKHLPLSSYPPVMMDFLKEDVIKPIIRRCSKLDPLTSGGVSIDINKCYSSVLLDMEDDFPLMSINDTALEYTPELGLPVGYYYILYPFSIAGDTIVLDRGWYPHNFVKYCLGREYINVHCIGLVLPSSYTLPKDLFKSFVKKVVEMFGSDAKSLINHFIGFLGQKYMSTCEAAITDSAEVAIAMANSLGHPTTSKGVDFKIHRQGDLFFLRKRNKVLKTEGYLGIYHQIIAGAYIKLDQLHSAAAGPDSVVLGYNTDSLKIINPILTNLNFSKEIGEYRIEECCTVRSSLNTPHKIVHTPEGTLRIQLAVEEMRLEAGKEDKYSYPDYLPYTEQKKIIEFDTQNIAFGNLREGVFIQGPGGAGKSYYITRLNLNGDPKNKVLYTSFTGVATSRLVAENPNTGAVTLDTVLHQDKSEKENILTGCSYTHIIIDECFMTPYHHWQLLYKIKLAKPSIKIILAGDIHQARFAISRKIDWFKTDLFWFLVDYNYCELPYAGKRYTAELKAVCDHLLEHKSLPPIAGNELVDKPLFTICKNPATRNRLNNIRAKLLKPGDKVVYAAFQNAPEYGIYNSDRFISVVPPEDEKGEGTSPDNTSSEEMTHWKTGKKFIITDELKKACNLKYGFVDTLIRWQGAEIRNEKFNIIELDQMTYQEAYTCLTRGVELGNVGFDSSKVPESFPEWEADEYNLPYQMKDVGRLKTGYIYKIEDSEGKIYIGQTKRSVEERFAEHQDPNGGCSQKMKKWLSEGGAKCQTILTVKYHERYFEKKLDKHEQQCIASYGANMNTKHAIQVAKEEPVVEVGTVQLNRYKVRDDEKKKRFMILWRESGKVTAKTFSYSKGNDKESVRKEAEAFAAELCKKRLA